MNKILVLLTLLFNACSITMNRTADNNAPIILIHPQDLTICANGDKEQTIEFSVEATGEELNYTWIGNYGGKEFFIEDWPDVTFNSINELLSITAKIGEAEAAILVEVCNQYGCTRSNSAQLNSISCDDPEEIYEIGDTGPAGGLIFYIDEKDVFPWTYLEAAPEDIASKQIWGMSEEILGADGVLVGTGATNTITIMSTEVTSAARTCNSYVSPNDTMGWFLPSEHELNWIYVNLYLSGLGEFSDNTYWSSTEFDELNAQTINFSTGSFNTASKTSLITTRCIRSF